MSQIVNGEEFLKLPVGTLFLDGGFKCVKTGDRKADIGGKVIGYYFRFLEGEDSGEETSATMLCPVASKFKVLNKEPK